jgi:hypothetical protein
MSKLVRMLRNVKGLNWGGAGTVGQVESHFSMPTPPLCYISYMSKKGLGDVQFAGKVKTQTSLFLFAWLVVLAVSPLAHSASPYAGNQGSATKSTPVPTHPPITPAPQGIKPTPIQNPAKGNVGTTGDKK